MIYAIHESQKDKKVIEKLYIPNSNEYLKYLKIMKLDIFYQDFYDEVCLNFKQKEFLQIIDEQKEKVKTMNIEKEKILLSCLAKGRTDFLNAYNCYFKESFKISIKETFVQIYNSKNRYSNDLNLNSFNSSLNLFDDLTEISQRISKLKEDQYEELISEVNKLNEFLPSNTYIPFLSESIRNYFIVHIPLSQIKIFKTKTRSPFLIQFELVRIDEINKIIKRNLAKQSLNVNNLNLQGLNKITLKTNETNNKNSNLMGNQNEVDKSTHQHKGSLDSNEDSGFNYGEEHDYNEKLLDQKKRSTTTFNPKSKFGEGNNNQYIQTNKSNSKEQQNSEFNNNLLVESNNIKNRKRPSTIKLLFESDIKVSKPLTLMNLEKNQHHNKLIQECNIIEEQIDDEEEEDNNNAIGVEADNKINTAIHESFINNTNKNFIYENLDNNLINNKNNTFINEETIFETNNLEKEIESKTEDNCIDVPPTIKDNLENKNTICQETIIVKSDSSKKLNSKLITIEFKEENKDLFGSEDEEEILKDLSPYGNFSTWRTFKCIIKSGEDLRQEQFASQLINLFNQIFRVEKVNCWVKPYEVISTGQDVGVIECVNYAMSLDSLKKKMKSSNLKEFFVNYFGGLKNIQQSQQTKRYKNAVNSFIESLAGNCLVSYFLQIKDRHNGNILLDNEGHLIHIDFGFIFTIAPGKGFEFEKAPFKLTNEFVQVMDGADSSYFEKFRKLLWKGFVACNKHAERIIILVEMMLFGHGESLPCFKKSDYVLEEIRKRFYPFENIKGKKNTSKTDYFKHVDSLIELSLDNWRTKWYDKYQYYFQGIFY